MYCLLTITRYSSVKSIFGILSMALFRLPLTLNKSISFYKLMGSGKNGTFDAHPDWQQWALLTVLPAFQKNNINNNVAHNHPSSINYKKIYGSFISKWWQLFRCEVFTVVLKPIEGHGKWDGREIFGALPKQTDYEGLIAVLTRATIRLKRLKHFWKNVNSVANQMATSPGFITSVGVGEVPWIKQATFSVWQSKEAMKQFSYRMQPHLDVIRKTRSENWYSEEMFVRLKPIAAFGTLHGKNPLQGFL